MRKLDVLYDNLIGFLERMLKDRIVESYLANIGNETDKAQFERLISKINDVLEMNRYLKDENKRPSIESQFVEEIDHFASQFSDYPVLPVKQIKSIAVIVNKILELTGIDNDVEENIEPDDFQLVFNDKEIPHTHFFLDIGSHIQDSILLISTSDFNIFMDMITTEFSAESIDLLYHLLAKIKPDSDFEHNQYILIKPENSTELNKVRSFIKLKKVSLGEKIHVPHPYTNLPELPPNLNWNVDKEYQQFNEVIDILSEYNDQQKDILDKFLRMYHIIENFMYKYPICELEQKTGGKMFSIRDFRNLYSKVNKDELDSLKRFIRKVFDEVNYDTTNKFKNKIVSEWNSFINHHTTNHADINTLFTQLGMIQTCNNISSQEFVGFYSKLIYQFRCSIVHNKETEFHFTHSNMPPMVLLILEEFLLQSLEKIVFKLIVEKNNLISYTHPVLKLWET